MNQKHSNVTVNGINLAYGEAGEGRPLLCVHGNFASKRWFNEQLASPPAGWRVIALDLPNFADSATMLEAISIAAYADYLHGFIEALQLDQPVLLGHSLGGSVVQSYAAKHPTVRGLILVSSAAPDGLVTPEEHYALLESLKGNSAGMAQALTATMPTAKPDYFEEIVGDALKLNPAAFSGNARALEHLGLGPKLKDVTCPVLIIRGEHDYLVSKEMAQATAQAFSNAELELWNGIGHSPQLEDPVRFNQHLAAFLEGLP